MYINPNKDEANPMLKTLYPRGNPPHPILKGMNNSSLSGISSPNIAFSSNRSFRDRVSFGAQQKTQIPEKSDIGTSFPGLSEDVFELLDRPDPQLSGTVSLTPERRLELEAELAVYQQLRDVPEENDPPLRPVGCQGSKLIQLPEGYQSKAIQKVFENRKTLTLPTLSTIESLAPDTPLHFTVPIEKPDTFSVEPNAKAFMDLAHDIQAQQLVKAGVQPSMIGKNWKAIWGIEKTARDILQNFFDAHLGEDHHTTLEGTDIQVQKDTKTGKYHVLITGKGQYDYEKAYLLGGTSKDEDDTKAGNYGEGLKVLSLNLLRDYGADSVRMASANWQMTYTLPKEQPGEPKIFRHLEELKAQQPGSVMEFTTDNPKLVAQLFQSVNYFYHPYHPDFTGTVIKTPTGGIAIYDSPSQKGNVYLAGQRFALEKENNWEGTLDGMSIWTHGKSLDKGRDRMAVHQHELDSVVYKIIEDLSDKDLVHGILSLEEHWGALDKSPMGKFIGQMVSQMWRRKLSIPFDEKYYAGQKEHVPYEIIRNLGQMGFEFLDYSFQSIGATPLNDWHKYFANFKMITPSPGEKQRIQILHKLMLDFLIEGTQPNAAKDIPSVSSNHYPIEFKDCFKPIYVYDQAGVTGPDKLVQGRARYNATWFGNATLRLPLAEAFNVYAHELMHKHGDDGSESFSNAYDAYMVLLMEKMTGSSRFLEQLHQCEVLWNESIEKEPPPKPKDVLPPTPIPVPSLSKSPLGETLILEGFPVIKQLEPPVIPQQVVDSLSWIIEKGKSMTGKIRKLPNPKKSDSPPISRPQSGDSSDVNFKKEKGDD
jgi:hypothetical protein